MGLLWKNLVLVGFSLSLGWSMATAQESSEDDSLIAPLPEASAPQQDQSQRQELLKILRTEIEPNLPKADVEKLNRSVQRLGSYRDEWAQQAQDFLIANSSVAELYLFRYSLLANKRLNHRILRTLEGFSSFRFPQAVVAFADAFSAEKAEYLSLLTAALKQSPSLGPDALQVVLVQWGSALSLQQKLLFLSQTCSVWKSLGATPPELMQSTLQQASSFWENALAQEVRSCLKGY
jgi:hypothetical protein